MINDDKLMVKCEFNSQALISFIFLELMLKIKEFVEIILQCAIFFGVKIFKY